MGRAESGVWVMVDRCLPAKTMAAQAASLSSIGTITQPRPIRIVGTIARLEGKVGPGPSRYQVPNLRARNRFQRTHIAFGDKDTRVDRGLHCVSVPGNHKWPSGASI